MNRIAGPAANVRGGAESYPSVETLLREGSFYERLEKARVRRAEALARLAPDIEFAAEDALGALAADPVSPDASAAPDAPTDRRGKSFILNPARPFPAEDGDTLPVGKLLSAGDLSAQRAESVVEPAAAPVVRRKWRIAAGFASGLALGVAATVFAPMILAPTLPPAPAPAQTAPAPTATAKPLADAAIAPAELTASAAETAPALPVAAAAVTPAGRPAGLAPPPAAADAFAFAEPVATPPAMQTALPAPVAQPGNPDATMIATAPAAGTLPDALPPAALPATAPGDKPLRAQPSPPPPAPAALSLADANVRILAPNGTAKASIAALRDQLQKAGVKTIETAASTVALRKTQVRFYHEADRAAAAKLADAIGATLRDAGGSARAQPPGTIDIRYAASATSAVKARKTVRSRTLDAELAILRARILRQLQGTGN